MPVTNDGLHYELLGRGRRLILLHGGLGLDHTYFRPWLDPLSEVAELVFFDLEGNGRSRRPASFEGFDHTRWIAGVDAVRAELAGADEKFVLLGHSYGAFLALEYAARHHERLAGLVVVSGAPRVDYPDVIMANAARKGTPAQLAEVGRSLSQPTPDDDAMRAGWEDILPLYFHRFDPEVGRRATENIRYSAGALNRSMGVCLRDYDVVAALPRIDVPTLLCTGADDWITPPAQGGERLHAGLPRSELVIFEESGHFPFIEENERFLDVMRRWLASL